MQHAAQAFEAALGTSTTTLNQVRGEIVAALGSGWTGAAAARFGQALHQWCDEYQKVNVELKTMLDALEGNARLYQQTESGAAQVAAQALQSGLPGF
ncbi:hypothetical protein KRM28CT15_28590 [Krasilnikovia sp. M28-CT-15]